MSLAVLSLVIAVIFGVVLLYHLKPDKIERVYRFSERSRKIGGGIILIGVSWTFLRSGRPGLILIALVSIALATIYVAVERPDKALV